MSAIQLNQQIKLLLGYLSVMTNLIFQNLEICLLMYCLDLYLHSYLSTFFMVYMLNILSVSTMDLFGFGAFLSINI